MKTLEQLEFNNTYGRLADIFYTRLQTSPLHNQHLISFNSSAAALIQLDPEQSNRTDFVDIISGKKSLGGFDPLAMCYSGHQFGHYVPQLGDGRAVLLGEVLTEQGDKWDLQLKGAGPTAYSRNADGRAVLRSTIREYLCSEAMHALGIPSSRSLCMLGSNHEVYREEIETGAMLLRMAPSHIRFGSFEFFYYTQRHTELKQLADYVVEHHYPALAGSDNPYLELLKLVVKSTAELIAKWQSVGFAHGVMNTDNMSIHGITLDYGPYGFMEQYQPGYICNHSDHQGRYAFDKQPEIGLFNLSCLAQSLLPLLDDDPEQAAEIARAELKQYQTIFVEHYATLMRTKLGFKELHNGDQIICNELLQLMQEDRVDYSIAFRSLSAEDIQPVRDLFIQREAFDHWAIKYQTRLAAENSQRDERSRRMKAVNPKYILRNYLAEVAIRQADDEDDYSEIDRLLKILSKPFDEQPEFNDYAGHPPEWAQQIEVSCSS